MGYIPDSPIDRRSLAVYNTGSLKRVYIFSDYHRNLLSPGPNFNTTELMDRVLTIWLRWNAVSLPGGKKPDQNGFIPFLIFRNQLNIR